MTLIGISIEKLLLLNPHGLHIHKLTNADFAKFAAVTRILNPAKGKSGIRGHHSIDEDRSCLKLVDEALLFVFIAGPGSSAQSKRSAVSDSDRFSNAAGPEQNCHWTKHFFT